MPVGPGRCCSAGHGRRAPAQVGRRGHGPAGPERRRGAARPCSLARGRLAPLTSQNATSRGRSFPRGVPPGARRLTSRDARFQQWQALLGNRAKRQRSGEFIVQGVRPITLAVRHGWQIRALLYDADGAASRWARETLDAVAATKVAVSPELMHELGGKTDASPEPLAVVALPDHDLARIPPAPGMLTVVLDRPASPGNIGTLTRSAAAFGASGVIVTGHAADVYDPRSVRASTGSLFSLPVVRVPSHPPRRQLAKAL